MLRSKDVIGLPVIALDTGDEIGSVKDVIVHRLKKRVVGFLVRRPGWFQHLSVMPFSQATLDADSTFGIAAESELLSYNKATEEVRLLERKPLTGSILISTEGHEVGRISDFCFDERTGRLEGIDVLIESEGETPSNAKFLRLDETIFVGKYDVIINESAVEHVMNDSADISASESVGERSPVIQKPEISKTNPSIQSAMNHPVDSPAPLMKAPDGNQIKIVRDGSTLSISFDEQNNPDDLSIARLREKLVQLLAEDASCTVLSFDFKNFKYLPSIMLGLLANLKKKVSTVEILNPSRDSREILNIIGFDKLFAIRDRP